MSIKEIWNNLFSSFDNKQTSGFSARKLSAFIAMALVVYCHIDYVDKSVVVETICIDLGFVLLLLGIITMEQVIKFKSGTNEEAKPAEKNTAQNDPII